MAKYWQNNLAIWSHSFQQNFDDAGFVAINEFGMMDKLALLYVTLVATICGDLILSIFSIECQNSLSKYIYMYFSLQ